MSVDRQVRAGRRFDGEEVRPRDRSYVRGAAYKRLIERLGRTTISRPSLTTYVPGTMPGPDDHVELKGLEGWKEIRLPPRPDSDFETDL